MNNYQKIIEYFEEKMLEYGRQHPTQAAALLSGHRCPYTKHLIEAFCFIASHIEDQINDDFNKLAQQLIEIIWPHYMYPLPSSVILEFKPKQGSIKSSQTIKKGTEVLSVMIPDDKGFPCKFTTSSSILVRPLNISKVEKIRNEDHDILQLVFSKNKHITWENIGKQPLKIYLHGDQRIALSLYYFILKKVKSVSVKWSKFTKDFTPDVFQSVISNLDENFSLFSYPKYSFKGFQLLETYFNFPESLRYIKLDILSQLDIPDEISEFTVNLKMEYNNFSPGISNFKLNCVPATNLFDDDASSDPIKFDNSKSVHEIKINQEYVNHRFPIFVRRVIGSNKNKRFEYHPFISYRHEQDDKSSGYYLLKRQYDKNGQPKILIQIISSKNKKINETISLNLSCSNGYLAKLLGPGDIKIIDSTGLDFVEVQNITAPTESVYPKIENKELWTLINALSLNYLSLNNVEYVKKLLLLYDRKKDIANQKRIYGIDSVQLYSKPVRKIIKGCIVYGQLMDIILNNNNFTNNGDMLMFSEIFSKIISMYVSINSFCKIRVRKKNEKENFYECQIKGERSIL